MNDIHNQHVYILFLNISKKKEIPIRQWWFDIFPGKIKFKLKILYLLQLFLHLTPWLFDNVQHICSNRPNPSKVFRVTLLISPQ